MRSKSLSSAPFIFEFIPDGLGFVLWLSADLEKGKAGIISAVNSPLGFFTLIVLVIESTLGFLVYKDKVDDSSTIVLGMLLLLFCLVAVVSLIAYKRPESLGILTGSKENGNVGGSLSIQKRDYFYQEEMAAGQSNQLPKDSMLIYKFDQPPIDKIILSANEEILISGIDLGIMATKMGLFETKVKEGVKLKFVSMDNDENLILECSKFRGIESEDLESRLNFSHKRFSSELLSKFPEKVEFRTFENRPSFGFFILDPNDNERGKMNIAPYTFQGFGMDEPLLHISKRENKKLFDIFLGQFNLIWNNSKKLKV